MELPYSSSQRALAALLERVGTCILEERCTADGSASAYTMVPNLRERLWNRWGVS